MYKTITKIGLAGLIAFPYTSYAQTFKDFVRETVSLSQVVMPLLFSGALALFIWGVAQFILNSGNPEKRKEGKKRIGWGIIALFVLIGYLGLTAVLTGTLFGNSPFLPQLFTQ